MFLLLSERFWLALVNHGFRNLLLAIILYLVFNKTFKARIAFRYAAVMRLLHKGRFGLGGSARFIGLIEEWSHRWVSKEQERRKGWKIFHAKRTRGLFMGRSLFNRFLHVEIDDDRHMFTIGGSRAGKGASCIIPNLLTFEGSILCIDPKGENAKVTAQRRREMGQKVHIVDPFGIVGPETAQLNPLEFLDPTSKTIREDLAVIADALVVPSPTQKDGSHWDEGAKTILTGLIAKAAVEGKGMAMIRDLLDKSMLELAELWVDMRRNKEAGKAMRDAGGRATRGGKTDEITNIISNVDKSSEWLSYPSMEKLFEKSTFSFRELKERPTTIYLVIPPEYLDVHKRFLRLFINLALNEMPRGGKSKVPILMILDEFLQLGQMDHVLRAFRLLAGYNFIVWPFIQDIGGIEEIYGKGSFGSMAGSCRAVQVFGVNEPVTLEYVSKEIGKRSLQYALNVGDSLRVTPLREPDEAGIEIMREDKMQYILRSGKPTMILERVNYYETGRFIGWVQSENSYKRWFARKLYPFAGLYAPDPDYVQSKDGINNGPVSGRAAAATGA